MKNLLILGNGFDLYNNLPTKYLDFYKLIKCLEKDNYSDFKTEYLKICNKESIIWDDVSFKWYHDLFLKDYRKNFFVQYFSKIIDRDYSWIDVEKEIERIVVSFDMFFEAVDFRLSFEEKKTIRYFISDLNKIDKYSNGEDYREFLQNVFLKIDYCELYNSIDNVIDFCYDKACSFDNNQKVKVVEKITKDNMMKDFKDEFVNNLLKSLRKFEELFARYLFIFLKKDIEKNKFLNNVKPFINDIDNDFFQIVTYNYTNYSECLFNNSFTSYIHGKIDFLKYNDEEKEGIIFGFDSSNNERFFNEKFSIFSKRNRRVYHNTMINGIKDRINNSVKLFVFGHSLNGSDDDTLKFFINFVIDKYKSNILDYRKVRVAGDELNKILGEIREFKIVVFYYNSDAHISLIHNLSRIIGADVFNDLYYNNKIEFVRMN